MIRHNLTLLFLLITSHSAFAQQELPWYMTDIHSMNNADYYKNCKKINYTQDKRKIGLIAYNIILKNPYAREQQIEELKAQRDLFRAQLLDKENNILDAIQERYNIGQREWNTFLTQMTQLKSLFIQKRTKADPNITHDQRLPQSVQKHIRKLLEKNGINPQSVSLHVSDKDESCIRAEAAIVGEYQKTDSGINLQLVYAPASITFYKPFFQLNEKQQRAVCAHEVEHLVQNHGITDFAANYLKQFLNIGKREVNKLPEIRQLTIVHEEQAEIFAALKSSKTAALLVHHRLKSCYQNVLKEEHFYNLTTIYLLWQVQEAVEYFHSLTAKKIATAAKDEMALYIEEFTQSCRAKMNKWGISL